MVRIYLASLLVLFGNHDLLIIFVANAKCSALLIVCLSQWLIRSRSWILFHVALHPVGVRPSGAISKASTLWFVRFEAAFHVISRLSANRLGGLMESGCFGNRITQNRLLKGHCRLLLEDFYIITKITVSKILLFDDWRESSGYIWETALSAWWVIQRFLWINAWLFKCFFGFDAFVLLSVTFSLLVLDWNLLFRFFLWDLTVILYCWEIFLFFRRVLLLLIFWVCFLIICYRTFFHRRVILRLLFWLFFHWLIFNLRLSWILLLILQLLLRLILWLIRCWTLKVVLWDFFWNVLHFALQLWLNNICWFISDRENTNVFLFLIC